MPLAHALVSLTTAVVTRRHEPGLRVSNGCEEEIAFGRKFVPDDRCPRREREPAHSQAPAVRSPRTVTSHGKQLLPLSQLACPIVNRLVRNLVPMSSLQNAAAHLAHSQKSVSGLRTMSRPFSESRVIFDRERRNSLRLREGPIVKKFGTLSP